MAAALLEPASTGVGVSPGAVVVVVGTAVADIVAVGAIELSTVAVDPAVAETRLDLLPVVAVGVKLGTAIVPVTSGVLDSPSTAMPGASATVPPLCAGAASLPGG